MSASDVKKSDDAPAASEQGPQAPAPPAPQPERMARTTSGKGLRTYGSAQGVSVGDVVEIFLNGAWSEAPYTVIAETHGKYIVKLGFAGAPDLSLPGEPLWSPDVHGGLVPDNPLSWPDTIRSGEAFKAALDEIPLPSNSRPRVRSTKDASFLEEEGDGGCFGDCAEGCNACLECRCVGEGPKDTSKRGQERYPPAVSTVLT